MPPSQYHPLNPTPPSHYHPLNPTLSTPYHPLNNTPPSLSTPQGIGIGTEAGDDPPELALSAIFTSKGKCRCPPCL